MIKADKILIRSPNWVGDVVMATPAFRSIRNNFPSAEISIILKPYVKQILKDSPWFDNFIEYGNKVKLLGKNYRKLAKELKNEKYDLGFIFPNSFSSAMLFWMANVNRRIGYIRDARGWMLTDGVEREMEDGKFKPAYMADFYLKLCETTGCPPEESRLELFTSEESENRLSAILAKQNMPEKEFLILVNPGAAYGSSKCWTAKGFAETIDELNNRLDCNILLVTGPGEIEPANDIEKAAKTDTINLANENITLDLLKPLIKRCSLLLTVDSGPRHFAVAFNRPVVTLMGPTDPRYTETGYETGRVIRLDVDCGPCHKKTCPTDHKCMRDIRPETVAEACVELLTVRG